MPSLICLMIASIMQHHTFHNQSTLLFLRVFRFLWRRQIFIKRISRFLRYNEHEKHWNCLFSLIENKEQDDNNLQTSLTMERKQLHISSDNRKQSAKHFHILSFTAYANFTFNLSIRADGKHNIPTFS